VADVPAVLVTLRSTTPAAPAGEVAVIWVGELTVTAVPAPAPNATVEPVMNPVPVIVTTVPPASGPDVGLIAVTVGVTAVYVNLSVPTIADWPPGVLVTRTSIWVALIVAGEVAVMEVAEFTTTPVAAFVPNTTVALLRKLVPVIVTDVPPVVGPVLGLTEETAGVTALKVNRSEGLVGDVPPEVVTVTSTVPVVVLAGDVAVIDVAEFSVTVAAACAPNDTDAPVMKLVPVIVTDVPPPVGPDVGLIDVTVGVTAW